MFRFTIRDVFWLILFVGFALTWWREGINLDGEKRALEAETRNVRSELTNANKIMNVRVYSESYFVADGWHTYANPDHYEIALDMDTRHSGAASAAIKAIPADPTSHAFLFQIIRAEEYRGQRLRLTGNLKTENAKGTSFTMHIMPGAFALGKHSCQQFLEGTVDWQRCELVLDIPDDANTITFGIVAKGGSTWLDDLQFDVVGPDVPTTTTRAQYSDPLVRPLLPKNLPFPMRPLNLDFEH